MGGFQYSQKDMEQIFFPSRILIVYKTENTAAAELARRISQWVTARGRHAEVVRAGGGAGYARHAADLVVVLGGDGTMLEVARAFVDTPVPLAGLNFGKVGFLAEWRADQWEEGLADVLEGRCRILKRMALGWEVLRGGEIVRRGVAVNDVVISRGALSRVISLDVSAGGSPVCLVRADGLILSTPSGVSGYAVSAGGPLVHPDFDAVIVTPICPFLCNFPPMVLPPRLRTRVEVLPGSVESFLTADGQENIALAAGDAVETFGMPERAHYARTGVNTYFRRLKARGFIEEYPGALVQEA